MLRLITTLLFVLLGQPSNAANALEPVVPGEPMKTALDRYLAAGLNIISTQRLVSRNLRATLTPDSGLPLTEQVRQLLSPHDLTLVMTDHRTGYVSRRRDASGDAAPGSRQVATRASPDYLEEIVVSGRYRVQSNLRRSTSLYHEDLLSLPAIGRDALRGTSALPGMASSGVSARARVRGGDADEVLYMIDGVELVEPFHLRNFQNLFSVVNPNVLDIVDVYTSGFPVTLGTRMSGVVDLQLIEPTDTVQGELDLNLVTAAANARGFSGPWSWLVSTRASVLGLALNQLEQDFGDPRFSDHLVRLSWQDGAHEVTFGALAANDHVTVRDEGAGEDGKADYHYRSSWLNWQTQLNDRITSRVGMHWSEVENRRSGRLNDPESAIGSLVEVRNFDLLKLTNDWTWVSGNDARIEFGWSYAQNRGDFAADFLSVYGPLGRPLQESAVVARQINLDRSGDAAEAYVLWSRSFYNGVDLALGMRYDGQDFDPVHVNELSSRARLGWSVTDAVTLMLDLGRYTQPQQVYEVQIDDGSAEIVPPQHADQVNLGLAYSPARGRQVRLDAYYRKISDPWPHFENLYNPWVLLPELHGDRYELAADEARVKGVELAYTHDFSEGGHAYISYAQISALELVEGRWVDRPWQQRHTLKGGLRWQNRNWRLGVQVVYRDGWPTTPLIRESSQLADNLYADQLATFFSLDVHVSRMFSGPHGEFELYLDITNATNRRNPGGHRYHLDERRETRYLLPVLPVLGLSWRW